MADFFEDEAPLPSIEEFFDDTVGDLEVSIGELSIEGKHMGHKIISSFPSTFGSPLLSLDACLICDFAVYFEDQCQTSTPKRGRSILKELEEASETREMGF